MRKILLIGLLLLIPSVVFSATNFPGSLDSYSTKNAGDTIDEGDINDPQDAIEAIEAKTGTGADTPTSGDVFIGTGAGTSGWATLATAMPYIKVSDVKAQNTAGGTFTQDAWQTRVINTEDTDSGSYCSIASNQITLAAGTYDCYIKCPAYLVSFHQARLQNITDASTTLIGTSEFTDTGDAVQTSSVIIGRFTIATQKTFEVQHYCASTLATNGFGRACNFTSEVYTIAEFWKVA